MEKFRNFGEKMLIFGKFLGKNLQFFLFKNGKKYFFFKFWDFWENIMRILGKICEICSIFFFFFPSPPSAHPGEFSVPRDFAIAEFSKFSKLSSEASALPQPGEQMLVTKFSSLGNSGVKIEFLGIF